MVKLSKYVKQNLFLNNWNKCINLMYNILYRNHVYVTIFTDSLYCAIMYNFVILNSLPPATYNKILIQINIYERDEA